MNYLESIGRNAKKAFEDLKNINKYIKKIYSNYAQKFITLPKSSVQERTNFIIESIK